MFSTTKTLTKTLLMAVTLSLVAACDAEPEAADAGDDVAARPLGGMMLNTSFIGGFEYSELDTNFGTDHNGVILISVTIPSKRDQITLEKVWVEKGEIFGRKGVTIYKGHAFKDSRWALKLDYDHDGAFDSTIETTILAVSDNWTATGDFYYGYKFAYDSLTATGLVKKNIEQNETPTPTCEVDVDTGSLDSIAIGNLTTDLKSGDMDLRKDTIQLACTSSAMGKTPTWNYLPHKFDIKTYETIVRMVRADYCGDGVSWTEPGQKLQIEDTYLINGFFDGGLKDEAFWVEGAGAACLFRPRHPAVNYIDVFNHCGIPECKGDEVTGYYGDAFHTKLAS